MFCPTCGHEQKTQGAFCPKCGTNLQNLVTKEPTVARPASAASADQATTQTAAQPTGQPAAQPSGQSTAAAAWLRDPKALIAIGAAVIAVVALLVVMLVARPGGTNPIDPGNTAKLTSPNPTVKAPDGTDIKALERPSFFDALPEEETTTATPSAMSYTIEPGLANVNNTGQFYLTDQEKSLLEQNGFSVSVGTSGDEFFTTYELNRYLKEPNFVTVDSMMHTYHLYFSHLLKSTERTSLLASLNTLSKDMLQESVAQLEQLKGTEWESAAERNVAFFAVAASLLDPSTQVPSSVSSVVSTEVANVNAAGGISESPLFEHNVDYSQYIPRGYYAGDATLEPYFRAMMWYGQMNFKQSDEDLDRSALLMVLAMKGEALDQWTAIYSITSFFAGASDDCGYYEYYPIAQSVYGNDVTAADLPGNDKAWSQYHALTATMPAPQINSVVVNDGEDDDVLAEEKGFRFMGQRFSLDASIFQKLMYSEVGPNASGQKRMLPNALDVPAALGSDEALSILEGKGATAYEGYSENMQELRASITEDNPTLWEASLYSQWLYTLNPLLKVKGEGYPSFMQSQAWTRKNLQTYLGSYTELKHDTVLYSKQALAEFGGQIPEKDDRGYVECEPEVFSRLARLTQATSTGLSSYGMLSATDADNLAKLQSLAEQLATIADKELRGELPSDAEFELIRSYGGQIEHFWVEVYKDQADRPSFRAEEFPAAIVTDVATDPNGSVLELGTGKPSTIKVVVPIDGELHIAEGTVFCFYQFEQPLSQRLTDQAWRQMLNAGQASIEDWTTMFQYEKQY